MKKLEEWFGSFFIAAGLACFILCGGGTTFESVAILFAGGALSLVAGLLIYRVGGRRDLMAETLSLNEAVELFRDYGILVSPKALGALIESGAFPFAHCVRTSDVGERIFLIFKKPCLKFLEEMSNEQME